MKNFVRLNKNEMKMILGGNFEEIEDGAAGTKYQCCPDLSSNNVSCSVCVEGPSTMTCPIGKLVKC